MLRERTGKGEVEIFVARQRTILVARDDLMEINVVSKYPELLESDGIRTDRERVADMDFAEPYAVALQPSQCVRRLFELDREVARVVVDTQVRIQTRIARMFLAQPVEKAGCLDAVLEKPERFGFEAQMQFATRPLC